MKISIQLWTFLYKTIQGRIIFPMSLVTFEPSGVTISVESGTALLDAARRAGVEIDAPCGGKGTCGNCAVRIAAGRVVYETTGMLSPAQIHDGFVLACRAAVGEADATVNSTDLSRADEGQFCDDDEISIGRPAWLPEPEEIQPLTEKILLQTPSPKKADGRSDLDRLTSALNERLGEGNFCIGLPTIRRLAETLRAEEGGITVTISTETAVAGQYRTRKGGPGGKRRGDVWITAVEQGDKTTEHRGVAIDIGTTTVAVQMVDLRTGTLLGTRTDYNGQLACGLDIISRIDYARRPDRREELRTRILKTVNRLIGRLSDHVRVDPETLSHAVISCNTTMTHLLLGLNPEYIRLDPFTPTVLFVPLLAASEIGLNIHPAAPIRISPAVGSYVGGDITAGLLCTSLAGGEEDVSLFMDIGTNGEVVLGNGEFLLASACSAGPAFEGGGIKCGMRAAAGAIEKVAIHPSTGLATVSTLGGVSPRGVCGSGMISLLAELLKTGWIDAAGKLNRCRPSDGIRIHGRRAAYVLVSATGSATGRDISVDEQDIENIIRAKAAIYAACSLMLAEVGMTFRNLKHVYIAGGFGRFLDLDDATTIGLLPHLPHDRFHFLGNTSLKGSRMLSLSRKYREKQNELARRMTYIELSTTPAYMDQYTAALFLPHTDPSAFL
jgi:uncharacterized 2Fe-2S/4Fe-4S cluster protein (DUF4445 family)